MTLTGEYNLENVETASVSNKKTNHSMRMGEKKLTVVIVDG